MRGSQACLEGDRRVGDKLSIRGEVDQLAAQPTGNSRVCFCFFWGEGEGGGADSVTASCDLTRRGLRVNNEASAGIA